MRKRISLLLIGLALLTSGCGPELPLKVAMRQAVTDVLYGSRHKPAPVPTPTPIDVYVPPPVQTFAFPGPLSVVPSPTPTVCAKLNPLTVVQEPATAVINSPPPQGSYVMRSSGSQSLGSSPKSALPSTMYLIQPGQPKRGTDQVDGSYYDYSMITGYSKTNYTQFNLRLANNNSATPGILVTSMQMRDPLRGDFTLVPAQPFQLLPTPVSVGLSWQAAATDPIEQTSIEFQANIPKKDTVDACGTPLDSFQVHISGNLVSPTFQLTWTADYDIGTQYGGLILAEHVNLSGPDSIRSPAETYTYDETSIINTQPPLAP